MRRIVEYTLLTADGVFENPVSWRFMDFRDDAYLRDGLALLESCEGKLMGRTSYEANSRIWPGPGKGHPWAARLNTMPKYVFSSTLDTPAWGNTSVIRGDVVAEVTKLKQQSGGDILIWGHTRLAETLLKHRLVDQIDLSIHPVMVGHGKPFLRDGQSANLKLVAVKSFSKIVKLSYEPEY
jgi:dihydrofolate reductase